MDKQSQSLFVSALGALAFVLLIAFLVWITQVQPQVAASTPQEEPAHSAPAEVEAEDAVEEIVYEMSGDAVHGEEMFASTCSACHGPGGVGIEGLGKDMTQSEFIAGQTDADLITFIKLGRGTGDPLNTTGVDMPPKGGNPSLSEEDLNDIVTYIRTIHTN